MLVTINDEPREVADAICVSDLLAFLELRSTHVAVEVNLNLVPRGRHAEHVLRDGDRIEIVTFVGGG